MSEYEKYYFKMSQADFEYRFEPIGTAQRNDHRRRKSELKKASTRRREKFENLFSLKLYFFKKKKQNFSLNFIKHLYFLHDSTNRTTVVRPRCCAVFPDISFLKRSLLFSLFTFMPLWGRRRRRRVFLLLHSHLL